MATEYSHESPDMAKGSLRFFDNAAGQYVRYVCCYCGQDLTSDHQCDQSPDARIKKLEESHNALARQVADQKTRVSINVNTIRDHLAELEKRVSQLSTQQSYDHEQLQQAARRAQELSKRVDETIKREVADALAASFQPEEEQERPFLNVPAGDHGTGPSIDVKGPHSADAANRAIEGEAEWLEYRLRCAICERSFAEKDVWQKVHVECLQNLRRGIIRDERPERPPIETYTEGGKPPPPPKLDPEDHHANT